MRFLKYNDNCYNPLNATYSFGELLNRYEVFAYVQESIRQSAIQLFSEAFSAWKLDGTAQIIASQLFKALASTLARISQQMLLHPKKPTCPCDWPDKIFGIVVKIVVKTKWGQPTNKKIQRFLTWNRWIYGPSGENRNHGLLNPIVLLSKTQCTIRYCLDSVSLNFKCIIPFCFIGCQDVSFLLW